MWGIQKNGTRWTHLEGRDRDTDGKNVGMETKGFSKRRVG